MTNRINVNLNTSNTRSLNKLKWSFCCKVCFAESESECICSRIVGYDADHGYPIIDLTDEEWHYLHNQ